MYKKWKGSYQYNNYKIQKIIGFSHTNFECEIIPLLINEIEGWITDDVATGGTPGRGKIIGKVFGNQIGFIKKMPVKSVVSGKKIILMQNEKHRDIFYKGMISPDGRSMSGEWKFKFGFGFVGILPTVFLPSSGTWEMKAIE